MAEPLMQSIRRHPDRIALVVSGREVTYREFGDRVNAMTASLRDRGVGAGDRVAFLLPNGLHIVEVYFALQKLGAVAVPLNFRSVPEEILHLCASAEVSALVFGKEATERVLAAYERARKWILDNPDEAAAILAEEAKLSPEVAKRELVDRTVLTGSPVPGEEQAAVLREIIPIFEAEKQVKEGVDVNKTLGELFAPQYIQKLAQQ